MTAIPTKLLWLFALTATAVALLGAVLVVSHQDAARSVRNERRDAARAARVAREDARQACLIGLRVRRPLAKYVNSEVALIAQLKALHIPTTPGQSPKVAQLQQRSYRNLGVLQRALDRAVKAGCPEDATAPSG